MARGIVRAAQNRDLPALVPEREAGNRVVAVFHPHALRSAFEAEEPRSGKKQPSSSPERFSS
ncbi:hypothetical protein GCM10010466_56920 [Planomonospora alba]|uniref:Uncharacterized protein n=1 Tax=Planomonospora alba TaxID=161354 RepID=A0ABP6NVN1_9ACTN